MCPRCRKPIRGANKKKVGSVWQHKRCRQARSDGHSGRLKTMLEAAEDGGDDYDDGPEDGQDF